MKEGGREEGKEGGREGGKGRTPVSAHRSRRQSLSSGPK
jgi:hypothetical protein